MSRAGVSEALARLDAESWDEYREFARVADSRLVGAADPDEDFRTPLGQFKRSDGGDPLGPGFPSGTPRREGSHRAAWMDVVREDPCAYCGERVGGTVDHIEPQRGANAAAPGECHNWMNYTGCCPTCNVSKGDKPLLAWLRGRWVRRLPARTHGRTPAKDRRARERDASSDVLRYAA